MIFSTLTIQNFMSIRSASIDLSNRGLVLINGVNHDNEALNNNGAGKSSILEALVYVLYGRTIRGLKGDEVVHKIPKKNTKVSLEVIDDDGVKYLITRYRKHSTNKNKSTLFRNKIDITPKSEADFNEYVVQLLQADYTTFTSSLLYSAESFRFTMATDAEIKKTFDNMLSLDTLTKCLEITKEHIKTTNWSIQKVNESIGSYNSQITNIDSRIEEAKELRVQYETKRKEKEDTYKSQISELESEITELNEESKELSVLEQSLQKKLDKHEKSLASHKKKSNQLVELKQELSLILQDKRTVETQIKSSETTIKDNNKRKERLEESVKKQESKKSVLLNKMAELDNQIGQPCPTCGQPLTKESLEPAKEEYKERIKEHDDNIAEFVASIQSLSDSTDNLNKSIESHKKQLSELEESESEFLSLLDKFKGIESELEESEKLVKSVQSKLNKCQSDIKLVNNDISNKKDMIVKIQQDIKANTKDKNPYDDTIKSLEDDKIEVKHHIEECNKELIKHKDTIEKLMFWQQAYSNQGIKSFILDDITPFLNRRVNKYLSKLSSGRIEVVFSTRTKLKSGEEREKFSIDVYNSDGGEQYIANSGGEKKRIDLAINMALQDLVASRSSKKINIAVFDEAFDALDESGVEGVIELLQELSKDKSTIMVVSHNEHLKSYFTNTITVVKQDGYSSILNNDEQLSM